MWTERNTRRHGEKGRSVDASVRWAVDIACDLATPPKIPKEKGTRKWTPPAANNIKINVDAGFDESSRSGSTGVIIRNHYGEIIRAQALWYEFAADARSMEALALRDGIRLADDLGLDNLEVESDALEVVNLCTAGSFRRADIGAFFQQVQDLRDCFQSCTIRYIPREANEAAHRCAKQASSARRRCLWVNYVPVFLRDCMHQTCNPME